MYKVVHSRLASCCREKVKANKGETLIIGGGDLYHGTALSNMLNGTPMVEFFNLIQLDVASLGNHEFDWSLDTLNNATLTDTAYSTLCVNLRYGVNYPADKLPEGKSIGDRALGGLPRPDSEEPVEVIGTFPFAGVICEYDSTSAEQKIAAAA